jgi:hypothetical protein
MAAYSHAYEQSLDLRDCWQWTPVADTIGVSLLDLRNELTTDDGGGAFGTDDIESASLKNVVGRMIQPGMMISVAPTARMILRLSLPGSVQKTTDSDDR